MYNRTPSLIDLPLQKTTWRFETCLNFVFLHSNQQKEKHSIYATWKVDG